MDFRDPETLSLKGLKYFYYTFFTKNIYIFYNVRVVPDPVEGN